MIGRVQHDQADQSAEAMNSASSRDQSSFGADQMPAEGASGTLGNDQYYGPQANMNWQDLPQIPQPEPEYLIVDWYADSRVTRQRSKEYYSSLAVIVLLLSLILFFANQVVLIFVLLSFLFISYVLASVKAETVHHMITTYGIRYRGELYYWDQMRRFWVRNNHGFIEIHIEIPHLWFNEIILLPANESSQVDLTAEELVDLLSRYLPYEEPIPTQFDHWVQWLEEKFPLEKEAYPAQSTSAQPEPVPFPQEPKVDEAKPQR